MACEARITRVLRILGYPEVDGTARQGTASTSLFDKPEQLARIVSWIEDRKIRGRAIPDRAPLRTPDPAWEGAFFCYLRELDCPCLPHPSGQQGDEARTSLIQGMSWLVNKAVACEYEDNGKEYNDAARQLVENSALHSSPSGPAKALTPESSENPGDAPWPAEFLSSLDAACMTMGLDPPLLQLPSPPPKSLQAPAPSHDGLGKSQDTRVLHALEALLAEAKKRRLDVKDGAGLRELEGFPSGVTTGDEACDRVATVLRMLYLLDLRELQDGVNDVLAVALRA